MQPENRRSFVKKSAATSISLSSATFFSSLIRARGEEGGGETTVFFDTTNATNEATTIATTEATTEVFETTFVTSEETTIGTTEVFETTNAVTDVTTELFETTVEVIDVTNETTEDFFETTVGPTEENTEAVTTEATQVTTAVRLKNIVCIDEVTHSPIKFFTQYASAKTTNGHPPGANADPTDIVVLAVIHLNPFWRTGEEFLTVHCSDTAYLVLFCVSKTEYNKISVGQPLQDVAYQWCTSKYPAPVGNGWWGGDQSKKPPITDIGWFATTFDWDPQTDKVKASGLGDTIRGGGLVPLQTSLPSCLSEIAKMNIAVPAGGSIKWLVSGSRDVNGDGVGFNRLIVIVQIYDADGLVVGDITPTDPINDDGVTMFTQWDHVPDNT